MVGELLSFWGPAYFQGLLVLVSGSGIMRFRFLTKHGFIEDS